MTAIWRGGAGQPTNHQLIEAHNMQSMLNDYMGENKEMTFDFVVAQLQAIAEDDPDRDKLILIRDDLAYQLDHELDEDDVADEIDAIEPDADEEAVSSAPLPFGATRLTGIKARGAGPGG